MSASRGAVGAGNKRNERCPKLRPRRPGAAVIILLIISTLFTGNINKLVFLNGNMFEHFLLLRHSSVALSVKESKGKRYPVPVDQIALQSLIL